MTNERKLVEELRLHYTPSGEQQAGIALLA
jgi:hypothetical protein